MTKWPRLSIYLEVDLFIPLDFFFAERVLSKREKKREEEIALLAFLLALSRQGHLAFSIDEVDKALEMLPKKQPVALEPLAQMLRTAVECDMPVFESACVYREGSWIYLRKNAECEKQIAHQLLRLLSAPPLRQHDFAKEKIQGNTEQRSAILCAAKHSLSLIIGGPGTGKTFVAAQSIKMFAALEPKMRIALAAPTGKAVAQLQSYLHSHSLDEERIRFKTVHALLGLSRESREETEVLPLCEDVILVDECSMLDARLFAHLLVAMQTGSRLILVGDPDQLPPVEAGSIFADLVQAAEDGFSLSVTKLTECLRSDRQEIVQFAEAIRTRDVTYAIELLQDRWIDLSPFEISGAYKNLWERHHKRFPSFFKGEPGAKELMRDLDAFRILSCMRQGPYGVDAINRYFAEQFMKEAQLDIWWATPILMSESSASLEVYNGDSGIIVRHLCSYRRAEELREGDYALFPDRKEKNAFRKIPALALPSFEWGYCLSAHKSQGSEYEEVFILIPPGSEVFGREVLYTAATRAKKTLACAGSLDVLKDVIQNRSRKISGLPARLKRRNS